MNVLVYGTGVSLTDISISVHLAFQDGIQRYCPDVACKPPELGLYAREYSSKARQEPKPKFFKPTILPSDLIIYQDSLSTPKHAVHSTRVTRACPA